MTDEIGIRYHNGRYWNEKESEQPPDRYWDGELKKITFDDALLKESKEILEDLIVAAHNDAKTKLKKKTSEEISKVTGGVSLPDGFKLPFWGKKWLTVTLKR